MSARPPVAPAVLRTGLPPVLRQDTRLVVLGSFPGVASLDAGRYYAHPRNQFWRLMSDVLGVALVPLDDPARRETLLAHGVGLWDVVARARRQGSLDGSIRQRDDNDLPALLARHAAVRAVAFNGAAAARWGLRALGARAGAYRIVTLPSSSPAHTTPYEAKANAWRVLRECLAATASRTA